MLKNLRKRRDAAGLSRYQLALRAGVSPNTIEQIERGTSGTSVKVAQKLAKALGTTVADLLGEKAKEAL
jgi:transcriptional regulator with XRE-family HTH domain